MSDTPRTDQYVAIVRGHWSECFSEREVANFARALERELAAFRAENERLREALREIFAGNDSDEDGYIWAIGVARRALEATGKPPGPTA